MCGLYPAAAHIGQGQRAHAEQRCASNNVTYVYVVDRRECTSDYTVVHVIILATTTRREHARESRVSLYSKHAWREHIAPASRAYILRTILTLNT